MGKIREFGMRMGLAAGMLAAGEGASHAQTPGKEPAKRERAETAFSPQAGFEKLVRDYTGMDAKAGLKQMKDLEQLNRQRAAKNEEGSAEIWTGLADTYKNMYEVLTLVQTEIALLQAKQDAGINSIKLSGAFSELDRGSKRLQLVKNLKAESALSSEERIMLPKLAEFANITRSFIKDERQHNGATGLMKLGDEMTFEDEMKMLK